MVAVAELRWLQASCPAGSTATSGLRRRHDSCIWRQGDDRLGLFTVDLPIKKIVIYSGTATSQQPDFPDFPDFFDFPL